MRHASLGSLKEAKRQAVLLALESHTALGITEVVARDVPSEVSEHPVFIEDIYTGARNRARYALVEGSDLGVGLQTGCLSIPCTGLMLIMNVCAVLAGDNRVLYGTSPGFMYPPSASLTSEMLEKFIGIYSGGTQTYISWAAEAVSMALGAFEFGQLYR